MNFSVFFVPSVVKVLLIINLGYLFKLDDEADDKINGILNLSL